MFLFKFSPNTEALPDFSSEKQLDSSPRINFRKNCSTVSADTLRHLLRDVFHFLTTFFAPREKDKKAALSRSADSANGTLRRPVSVRSGTVGRQPAVSAHLQNAFRSSWSGSAPGGRGTGRKKGRPA
ncbi:unnamed protein product, partial [Nesidiocoris tenuis]